MALFESYERRIDKINSVLNSYGIASIEKNEKALNDQIKKVKEAYYNKLISESMDSPDILEIIKEKRNISKLHISLSNG